MALSFDDMQAMWDNILTASHTNVIEPLLAQDLAQHWASVRHGFMWLVLLAPGLWMDIAWAAGVSYDRRRTFAYRSFIYAMTTCLLFTYAGGISVHLLLGETAPVFSSDIALLAPIVTWFLIFFTPLRHLYTFLPIKLVFVVGQAICWQRCVCLGVELGMARFPKSFVMPLVFAVVGGSTGGVLMNLEKRFFGLDGGASTYGVKMSFLTGLFYYAQHTNALSRGLVEPMMSLTDAKVVVALILVGWAILSELWQPINPFAPLEAVFGLLFVDKEQAKVWYSPAPPAKSRKPQQQQQQLKSKKVGDSAGKAKSASSTAAPLVVEEDVVGLEDTPSQLRNRKKRN